MEWLADTNILLRAIHIGNPSQPIAVNAVAALRTRGEIVCVFPQNLVEFWVVATRPDSANGLGLTVDDALSEIEQIKLHFILKNDDETVFENWENLVKAYNVSGKRSRCPNRRRNANP